MPLGYINGYLLNAGIDVEVLDSYVLGLGIKEIIEKVNQIRLRIVGLSCLTPVMPLSYKIAEGIKAINKNIKIIFDGLYPSIKKVMQNIRIYGEFTLLLHKNYSITEKDLL